MTPPFLLHLSGEDIALDHWAAGPNGADEWRRMSIVPLDSPDLQAELTHMAQMTEGQPVRVVMPCDHVKCISLPQTHMDNTRVGAALIGQTPYPVEELRFDWVQRGKITHIAAIAFETIQEALDFTKSYGFAVEHITALPGEGWQNDFAIFPRKQGAVAPTPIEAAFADVPPPTPLSHTFGLFTLLQNRAVAAGVVAGIALLCAALWGVIFLRNAQTSNSAGPWHAYDIHPDAVPFAWAQIGRFTQQSPDMKQGAFTADSPIRAAGIPQLAPPPVAETNPQVFAVSFAEPVYNQPRDGSVLRMFTAVANLPLQLQPPARKGLGNTPITTVSRAALPRPAAQKAVFALPRIAVTEAGVATPPYRPATVAPGPLANNAPLAPTTDAADALIPPPLRPTARGDTQDGNTPPLAIPLGGYSIAELQALRPQSRPALDPVNVDDDVVLAAITDADVIVTAVPSSLRPLKRPASVQRAAARAAAPSATPRAPAAQAEEAVPVPRGPTRTSVAQAATQDSVIKLNRIALLGTFGTQSARKALVRLSNGRVKRVTVGDTLDGGQVAAVSSTQLRYIKSGRNITLKMP
ncbi:MAG: hypothetical protein AAF701_02480 [Pseudomonadota bacterium]